MYTPLINEIPEVIMLFVVNFMVRVLPVFAYEEFALLLIMMGSVVVSFMIWTPLSKKAATRA